MLYKKVKHFQYVKSENESDLLSWHHNSNYFYLLISLQLPGFPLHSITYSYLRHVLLTRNQNVCLIWQINGLV